jgi:hypothetical protein
MKINFPVITNKLTHPLIAHLQLVYEPTYIASKIDSYSFTFLDNYTVTKD